MTEERDLRDEFERAIDDPGYYVDHDLVGFNGLEHQTDAVLDRVQRHLDTAREQMAEQIAQAIEQVADWVDGQNEAERDRVVTTKYLRGFIADIAREHAKGDGDG